jgi:hypothetical protein
LDLGRALNFVKGLPLELGAAAAAAPAGFVIWYRRGARVPALALVFMAVVCFGVGVLYNVVDVASYFLPAYAVLSIAAAFALDALRGAARQVVPVAAGAAMLLNFGAVDLHDCRVAEGFLRDLLRSAPPHALVVSSGDTTTQAGRLASGAAGAPVLPAPHVGSTGAAGFDRILG